MTAPDRLWLAKGPEVPAPGPRNYSFSTLRAVEACPRRWSLERADYPAIWDQPGFPRRVYASTIAGTILHEALGDVVGRVGSRRLQLANPDEVLPEAHLIASLRSMGGITKVLNEKAARALEKLEINPRVSLQLGEIKDRVARELPTLRRRFQRLIGQLDLSEATAERPQRETGPQGDTGSARVEPGLHSEVWLEHAELKMGGRVDLLEVRPDGCIITDFKSGSHDESHMEQVLIYALLWTRDATRNPDGLPVTALRLVYPDGTVTVPVPDDRVLGDLEAQLTERITVASRLMTVAPATAKPSPDTCRWCSVRHLCEDYWTDSKREADQRGLPDPSSYFDVELRVDEVIGDWHYSATLLSLGWTAQPPVDLGDTVPLRTKAGDRRFLSLLRSGSVVRILGCALWTESEGDSSSPAYQLQLTTNSEVFRVVAEGDQEG